MCGGKGHEFLVGGGGTDLFGRPNSLGNHLCLNLVNLCGQVVFDLFDRGVDGLDRFAHVLSMDLQHLLKINTETIRLLSKVIDLLLHAIHYNPLDFIAGHLNWRIKL